MRRFWLRTSIYGVMVRLDMERLDREIRGQRIRHVREHRRQMSRRQLAQRVPGPKGTTTEKQIERVESGEWDTDDAMIEAIAEALGIPRDELDGDLRMMRLPGYTQLREDVSTTLALLRSVAEQTLSEEAWEVLVVELGLGDPPPEQHERERA